MRANDFEPCSLFHLSAFRVHGLLNSRSSLWSPCRLQLTANILHGHAKALGTGPESRRIRNNDPHHQKPQNEMRK